MKATYEIGEKFDFTVGQAVTCNGFDGNIGEVYTGELEGMVSVRLNRGSVVVSASFPDCYPR